MDPDVGDDRIDDQHWHISRGVPVALIITLMITLIAQTATAAWFVARLDGRVEVLEKAQLISAPQADRLTRVEEKLENVKTGISDIKLILQTAPRELKTR